MDTSPEYIKMCRMATELQEMWGPSRGDWFVLYDEIETIGDYSEDLHPIDYREEFPVSKKNCIWLPRIDQLISLLKMEYTSPEGFSILLPSNRPHEQDILYNYMGKKYNKSWNGEDWI